MIQIKTYLARLVAGGTIAGWLGEVVHVHVLGLGTGDDLVPLDGLDVAQVVVVQDTHAAMDNICKQKHIYFYHVALNEYKINPPTCATLILTK